jgi:PAS domain S-box-containing protein
MKIRMKFDLLVTAALCLVLFAGVTLYVATAELGREIHRNSVADSIIREVTEIRILAYEYFLHSEERMLLQLQMKQKSLSDIMSGLGHEETLDNMVITKIRKNNEEMSSIFSKLVDSRANSNAGRNAVLKLYEERLIGQFLSRSHVIVYDAFHLKIAGNTRLADAQKTAGVLIAMIFVILLGIVLAGAFWTRRDILKPLENLRDGAAIIGTGRLDHRINITSGDEIGQLSAAFDGMSESLKKRLEEQKKAERKISHLNLVLGAIRTIDQLLVREKDPLELIRRVCYILIETRGYHAAWIALFDKAGQVTETASAGFGETFSKIDPLIRKSHLAACSVAMSDPGVHVVKDPATQCPACPASCLYRNNSAIVSRLEHSERVFGMLVLSVDPVLAEIATERNLIEEVADDIAHSLHGIEMESRRRETEKMLRESERNYSGLAREFRALLDSNPDVLMLLSTDLSIKWANRGAELMSGISQNKLIGKSCFAVLHETKQPCNMCPALKCLKSGRLETGTIESKAGIIFDVRAVPIRNEFGEIVNIVKLARDMTEHRKMEEQLRQAQKMEAIGQLAGGVAHDFNNMLGVIQGYAGMIIKKIDKTDPLYDYIEEIIRASQRSAGLTRQLLAFARKQTIKPIIADLNQVIEQGRNMLCRMIGEDITLEFIKGADLWPVRIDPMQIDQALANLAVNARDAISGVGRVTIETANISIDDVFCKLHADFTPGDYVMISFGDNGCGMDEITLSRIFEPFFTTKEPGKGTGLGLATVYGIVKQNSGLINVYSQPGQGTTFRIFIPRTEGSATRETVTETRSYRGSETVLIVEDEPSFLNFCASTLRDLGYNVMAARSPGEALLISEKYDGHIHLLLSDVIMPFMNGSELKGKIVAMRPDIKTLFMSGYAPDFPDDYSEDKTEAQLLQKPFGIDDLSRKVREVLDIPSDAQY